MSLLEQIRKELENKDSETSKFFNEEIEKANQGAVAKNNELLAEVKKYKTSSKEQSDKISELETKIEEVENLKTESSKDLEQLKKNLSDQFSKKEKDLHNNLSKVKSQLNNAVIKSQLDDALVKFNIAAQHRDVIRSHIKLNNEIVISDDENPVALIGDKNISDFVSEWSKSDVAKNYIAASDNNGGGAGGSNNKGGANIDFDKLSAKELIALGRQK